MDSAEGPHGQKPISPAQEAVPLALSVIPSFSADEWLEWDAEIELTLAGTGGLLTSPTSTPKESVTRGLATIN